MHLRVMDEGTGSASGSEAGPEQPRTGEPPAGNDGCMSRGSPSAENRHQAVLRLVLRPSAPHVFSAKTCRPPGSQTGRIDALLCPFRPGFAPARQVRKRLVSHHVSAVSGSFAPFAPVPSCVCFQRVGVLENSWNLLTAKLAADRSPADGQGTEEPGRAMAQNPVWLECICHIHCIRVSGVRLDGLIDRRRAADDRSP